MMQSEKYKQIEDSDIQFFREFIEEDRLLINEVDRQAYGHDYTEDLHFLPELVLIPIHTEEISKIAAYCNQHRIPLTVRGAGTGLSGGALPSSGGIVLSMEKLDRLLEIDEENFQATVEPGMITQLFQEAVAEKGLYYPPDPASRGSSFIGGNLAESSGGPHAVKYGVTKDYVLNLEVVLADGSVIWTGANVLKNATGLNLTQLLVGSEGTLGIITKAVMRLIPLPKLDRLLLAPFKNAADACAIVARIFRRGISPSALEFMERDALDFAQKYVEGIEIPIEEGIEAHLLIELDGNDETELSKQAELLYELIAEYDCGEILYAESEAEKERLWKLRRSLGEAVKVNSIYKEEDTVVKRAELPALLKGVKAIGERYGFESVCYGHAGDGNLHVNILKGNLSEHSWNVELKSAIREIFQLCKALGGTISGEHGIGLVQKEYLDIMFSEREIQLQKDIKAVFDPKGILNPGKVFD